MHWILVAALLGARPLWAAPPWCYVPWRALGSGVLQENREAIGPLLSRVAVPQVPSVQQLSLPSTRPQSLRRGSAEPSPGLVDPWLEEARRLGVQDDFKILSDLRPRTLTKAERDALWAEATARGEAAGAAHESPQSPEAQEAASRAFLGHWITNAYEPGGKLTEAPGLAPPLWRVRTGNTHLDGAFSFVEANWDRLLRRSPAEKDGSLLPTPYPVLIASHGRFHESYYWDTYFAVKGLLSTGRLELAQMQAENFLEAIRTYGHIPNGMRDYYLSRSQPPLVSSLVREVVEASLAEAKSPADRQRVLNWVKRRALPLLQQDYEKFWMNPETRYDPKTGLNHHWDALNSPRPERHRFDNDAELGREYRDTRAGAESGRDFTETFGKEASQVAGVLLNSLLYKTERDLAYFSSLTGDAATTGRWDGAAARRRQAMDQHLWNEEKGRYENFNLRTQARIPHLSADGATAPLFAGLLDPAVAQDRARAARLRDALKTLELKGGIVASEIVASKDQWDRSTDDNAWAPDQMMAIAGLDRYGFGEDARRVAQKWTQTLASGFERHGGLFERMNATTQDRPPVDESKYPTQGGKDSGGFLWTNASLVWAVKYLGHEFLPATGNPSK